MYSEVQNILRIACYLDLYLLEEKQCISNYNRTLATERAKGLARFTLRCDFVLLLLVTLTDCFIMPI